MLSIEPSPIAIFIRLRAITSTYYSDRNSFWTFFIGKKSQMPSLATITYLWFRRISTFFTYGLTTRPMFFLSDRSPNARVTASRPPNLPIRIFPPACVLLSILPLPWPLRFGCRSGVRASASRKRCHRIGRPRNLLRVRHRALAWPIQESRGRQCQSSLPRAQAH